MDRAGSTSRAFRIQRILVPTDFSRPSLKAIRYAVRLAEQFGATVHLVYVREPTAIARDIEAFPTGLTEKEIVTRATEQLLSIADAEIEELVPVKTEVRLGKPCHEIAVAAREAGADLIIIATQGRTGLNRMLLGSTAELLVREAPCPVLVVREREREFIAKRSL